MSVGTGMILIAFLAVLGWIVANPEKHQPQRHEQARGEPGDRA